MYKIPFNLYFFNLKKSQDVLFTSSKYDETFFFSCFYGQLTSNGSAKDCRQTENEMNKIKHTTDNILLEYCNKMLIKSTLIGVGIRKEYRIILRIYFAFFIFWHSMDFQVFFSRVFHFFVCCCCLEFLGTFVSFQIKAFSAHYWRRFFGSLSIIIIFIFDCRDSFFFCAIFSIQCFCFSLFFSNHLQLCRKDKKYWERERDPADVCIS